MADEPQLLYLEPDDEITSLIRRLREAPAGPAVVVAPGRSRATSSVVALRLLARIARDEGRELSIVADAATRAIANEAGIAAFATVPEATSGQPAEPGPAARAPIHVVRGIEPMGSVAPRTSGGRPPADRPGAADETMAVRLPPPTGASPRVRPSQRGRPPSAPRAGIGLPLLLAVLAVALVVGAAVLPGATIRITPVSTPIGPIQYQLSATVAGRESGHLTSAKEAAATGERLEEVAATGSVTFSNWNTVAVEVPQGTHVSVPGGPVFATDKRIVVPRGKFNGGSINPGTASVAVTAVEGGPAGNVDAGAISNIDDASVRTFLRGFPDNPSRLVTNPKPTSGGLETKHPVISQEDVDALVATITADLQAQLTDALAGHPERIYAGPSATEQVAVEIAPDLVGTEDVATFSLSGALDYDRAYVQRSDIEDAARTRLAQDTVAVPAGRTILDGSMTLQIGAVTASGDALQIEVAVRAAAATAIDEAAVRERVAGMRADDAKAALADLGSVEIELWPGWVQDLPRLGFRISVETVAPGNAS